MLGSTGNQLYRQPKHRQAVIQAAHAQRTTTHILFNLRNTYSICAPQTLPAPDHGGGRQRDYELTEIAYKMGGPGRETNVNSAQNGSQGARPT